VKVMPTEQLPPAARLAPQVLLATPKGPLTPILEKVNDAPK